MEMVTKKEIKKKEDTKSSKEREKEIKERDRNCGKIIIKN
jgi:hypothetical protein